MSVSVLPSLIFLPSESNFCIRFSEMLSKNSIGHPTTYFPPPGGRGYGNSLGGAGLKSGGARASLTCSEDHFSYQAKILPNPYILTHPVRTNVYEGLV